MSGGSGTGKPTVIERIREFSVPLLAGVVLAILWANVDFDSYHAAAEHEWFGAGTHVNLHFFANEILMVFFFGVAAKEITEACLPGGALNPPRKAINPLMATIGGVVGPIGVYFAMTWLLDAPAEVSRGWGIPTATDIALAWLVARLVFGARHPAVSFLLLLAVADDALGLAIIAVFYPDPVHPTEPIYLGLVVLGMVAAWLLGKRDVKSFWPYVLVAGGVSWVGLHLAHLHPALALVPVVPFMPNRGLDEGLFHDTGSSTDTLSRFEHFFKAPVDFGLMAFGLANAGVPFAAIGPATWAVGAALIVGKTVGISVFALTANALGFSLPKGMRGRAVVLAGLVAGLGLTVALFVAGAAFSDPALRGSAKMGALLSSVAAPLAIVLGKLFGVKRKDTVDAGESEPALNASGRPSLRNPSQPEGEGVMDLGPPSGPAVEPLAKDEPSRGEA